MEEMLGADEGEATPEEEAPPEEEAAPAPATPPAKRGRPAAPRTPPNTKAGLSPGALHMHSLSTLALSYSMHPLVPLVGKIYIKAVRHVNAVARSAGCMRNILCSLATAFACHDTACKETCYLPTM